MEPFTTFMLLKLGALALRELAKEFDSGGVGAGKTPAPLTEEEVLSQKYSALIQRYHQIGWSIHVNSSDCSEEHLKSLKKALIPQEKLFHKYQYFQHECECVGWFLPPLKYPLARRKFNKEMEKLRERYLFTLGWFNEFQSINKGLFEFQRITVPNGPYTQEIVLRTTKVLKDKQRTKKRLVLFAAFCFAFVVLAFLFS